MSKFTVRLEPKSKPQQPFNKTVELIGGLSKFICCCPRCEFRVRSGCQPDGVQDKYCPNCGQALDWGPNGWM